MHPKLKSLFEEVEEQRHQLLNALSSLTHEQLNYSSTTGKWSTAEILSHLITAERLSVQYVHKKIQGIEKTTNTGLWEEVKMAVFIISQRLPGLRFRAPRIVVEQTRPMRDYPSLQTEWDGVRAELQRILDGLPEPLVSRKIYRHVIVGYLNLKHMLVFFREHVIHHKPQIRSQLQSLSLAKIPHV